MERRLGNQFTIIAIDVPFHGLTNWEQGLAFEPGNLVQFLLEIRTKLQKENIKFSLLGFSMGGRIALHLTELLADKVERLILLAPDGLQFNAWRFLAIETWLGDKFFSYTIHHPAWLLWLINKAEKFHFIHTGFADFALYYINDKRHRMLLYQRLIAIRNFKPSKGRLQKLIRKYRIPVKMMFGRFDKIIPYTGGEKFKEGMEEFVLIKIADAGHHLLSEVHADKIVQLIND